MLQRNIFEDADVLRGLSDKKLAWPWPDPLGDYMMEMLGRYRDVGKAAPGVLALGEGSLRLGEIQVEFELQ